MSGTIVLGIGNQLGGDDAAGNRVVDILNQRQRGAKALPTTEIMAIDVGTAPDSYTSVIRRRRPELLIVIDAADMGLPPGALRTIAPGEIRTLSFSTHLVPLSLFMSYVKEFCGKIVLVGIQPERTKIGTDVSKAVRKSVRRLAEAILDGRIAEIPPLEQRS
jgi:hydrogenase 3 maturation protease